jgi:hypothetical protein
MKKLALLFAAIAGMSGVANGIGISIDVGDRPYYNGPGYYVGSVHYCWIRGHWNRFHTVWIHGHYRPC